MGIQPVLSAPRSPGQRAYVERGIGTIRRECLAPVMVFREAGLSRHLPKFADSYQRSRRHLGLQKDTPESRPVQAPQAGRIVAIPEVVGCLIGTNVTPPEPRSDSELSPSHRVLY
jgi:putative transposase